MHNLLRKCPQMATRIQRTYLQSRSNSALIAKFAVCWKQILLTCLWTVKKWKVKHVPSLTIFSSEKNAICPNFTTLVPAAWDCFACFGEKPTMCNFNDADLIRNRKKQCVQKVMQLFSLPSFIFFSPKTALKLPTYMCWHQCHFSRAGRWIQPHESEINRTQQTNVRHVVPWICYTPYRTTAR